MAPLLKRITHYSKDTPENTVGIACYLNARENNSIVDEKNIIREFSDDVGFHHEFEEDDEENCRFIEITQDALDEKEARYPVLA